MFTRLSFFLSLLLVLESVSCNGDEDENKEGGTTDDDEPRLL